MIITAGCMTVIPWRPIERHFTSVVGIKNVLSFEIGGRLFPFGP